MDSERRNELAKRGLSFLRSAKDKAKRYAEDGSQKSQHLIGKVKVKAQNLHREMSSQASTPPKFFGKSSSSSPGNTLSPAPNTGSTGKSLSPSIWAKPLSAEDENVKNLCGLGFSVVAAKHALARCGGRVEDAGIWLLDEANTDEIMAAEVHARDVSPLTPGSIARISGLRGAARLNGVPVMLQCWDDESQRWVVQMPDGSAKSIRPRNLDLLDDAAAALAAAEMEHVQESPLQLKCGSCGKIFRSPSSGVTVICPYCQTQNVAPPAASAPATSVPVAPAPGSPLDELSRMMQDEEKKGAATRDVEDLRNQVLDMLGDTGSDTAETLQALSVEELLEVVASLGPEDEGVSAAASPSSSSKGSATGGRGVPPVADAAEAAALEAALLASSSCAAAAEPAERETERMRRLEAAEERQRAFEQKHGSMDDYRRQKQLERAGAAAAATQATEPSGAAAAASAAASPEAAAALATEASSVVPGIAEDSSAAEPSQLPLFEPPSRIGPGAETNSTNSEGPASASDTSGALDSAAVEEPRERRSPAAAEPVSPDVQRKEQELREMERRLKETADRVAKAEADQERQAAANAELLDSQARWRAEAEEAARQIQRLERERAAAQQAQTGPSVEVTPENEKKAPLPQEADGSEVSVRLEEQREELARLQAKAKSTAEEMEIEAERARLTAEDRELKLQEEEAEQRRLGNALREEQARLEQQRRSLVMLQQSLMEGVFRGEAARIEMTIDDSGVTEVHAGAGKDEAEATDDQSDDSEEVWDLDWSTVGEKMRKASESAAPTNASGVGAVVLRIPPPKEVESVEEDPTKKKMQEKLEERRQLVDSQSQSTPASPDVDRSAVEAAAAPAAGAPAPAEKVAVAADQV